MNQATKFQKIVSCICLGILVFFCSSIIISALKNFYQEDEIPTSNAIFIDWQDLYPFEEQENRYTSKQNPLVKTYETLYSYVLKMLSAYTKDFLIFYDDMVELYYQYTYYTNWNYSCFAEYNSVIELEDGHLSVCYPELDVTANINAIVNFNQYCQNHNIDFLYVQAPYKLCKYEDSISGIIDFTNQRADLLLDGLYNNNVSYLDFRTVLHNEDLSHHDLFYYTDHHWKAESGLWASRKIIDFINNTYGFKLDDSLLSQDCFTYSSHSHCFIGSHGKKTSRLQTPAEEFTFIYPIYNTSFDYELPTLQIDTIGDFSVIYDMDKNYIPDTSDIAMYAKYNYGDKPLINIKNNFATCSDRILIIKDSFGNVVTPFLALTTKHVDILDIRQFTGSVKKYIEETSPDIVLVLYNPSSISTINHDIHTSTFDFR